MDGLTYITTCKGRLEHIKQTLPKIAGQPNVQCVVVDYSCPENTGDWVASHFPQVKLVRVIGKEDFNASCARNLGAQAATTRWLGFFDADVILAPDFAANVIPSLEQGYFYRASQITLQTWGSLICCQNDFAAIGGYDEAFVGWGGEDDDLLIRLGAMGCKPASFSNTLLNEIAHDDDARVRFHEIKDRRVQCQINQIYIQAKMDLLRLSSNSSLPLETRQALFGEVRHTVLEAVAAGKATAEVAIEFPRQIMNSVPIDRQLASWGLARKLIYAFELLESTHRNEGFYP